MLGEQAQVEELLGSVKRQVQVGANSAAAVEYWAGQKVLRFSTSSFLAGMMVRLLEQKAVQLALPLFGPPQPESS